MPSGPPELHEKWGDDGVALRYLEERNFQVSRGGIIHGPLTREGTEEERSAIEYLCAEWDYGYQPRYGNKDYCVGKDSD